MHAYKGLDIEVWSIFEARGLVKELDFIVDYVRLWWKPSTLSLDNDLKKFSM